MAEPKSSPSSKPKAPRPAAGALAARIVDTALAQAEQVGWGVVRLSDVAAELKISPAELQRHFRDKDAVADAWFRRAWQAMLEAPPKGFAGEPAEARLYLLMMRWFDALSAHREVTGQMLREKLHLPHPHHWVPMIFNLSRTIQWLRDAALLEARGRRRQAEEIGLTALFLATLRVWLRDGSEDQSRTRDYLRRRLAAADRIVARVWSRSAAAEEDDRA